MEGWHLGQPSSHLLENAWNISGVWRTIGAPGHIYCDVFPKKEHVGGSDLWSGLTHGLLGAIAGIFVGQ